MSEIAPIIQILNLLGLGGLGLFLYYVIKGLKERVANLTDLATEQKATLEAVRARAVEMDKLSKDYKQALADFQDMGKKLDARRNELVAELESANQRKDKELARLANLELEEIELKKQSLQRLPDIERKLDDTVAELGRQLRIVSPSLMVQLKSRTRPDYLRDWLSHDWPLYKRDDSQRFLYLFLSSAFHDTGNTPAVLRDSSESSSPAKKRDDEGDKGDPTKPPDKPEDAG